MFARRLCTPEFSSRLIPIVFALWSVSASAEFFNTTPSRTVGPFVAGQATPIPGGGWLAADDRSIGASINAQNNWQTSAFNNRYDEELVAGVAHSGGHSWRLSNWFHTGLVNPILSPVFAPVGESGSTTQIGGGIPAQSNSVVYEFWFRSALTTAEPGTFVSTTISDAPGRRMTYLGIFDELAGDPDYPGVYHVDAVDVTNGATQEFTDHYSPALTRGAWYRMRISAQFVNGPLNDQVHYELFEAAGAPVWQATIGSWEDAYFQGQYGSTIGDKVASDHIAFRVSANPDDGTQQPFDTNSVSSRPHGVYFDDLRIAPAFGAAINTGFEADRYVATNGNNSGDCRNVNNPCLTIQYAIGQANPYDQINVASGVYPESNGPGSNLSIGKPVVVRGAQGGTDARTRSDVGASIIVPGVLDGSLTLGSLGASAVIDISSSGVTLDGLIIDGDNPGLTSAVTLNGSNPDADSGVFATGSNVTVQNCVIRNVGGSGIYGYMNSGSGGDNRVRLNRFDNMSAPSTSGRGIILADNFYAQIVDNLMTHVRTGVQTDNSSAVNPGIAEPSIARNEIHATRNGIFHNLFYGTASAYTISGNQFIADANAAQSGQWNGLWIESMGSSQTVVVQGNQIDGNALVGSGRNTVAYLLNNLTSDQSASTALDGGTVTHVNIGVLATDATFYTGPVNDIQVRNIAFSEIAVGALYVEDTLEQIGSAKLTVGSGNTYANVPRLLVLSGALPTVAFSAPGSGVSSVKVRSQRNYVYAANNSSGSVFTVANASINRAIGYAGAGALVAVESGTFDETVTIARDDLRLTADTPANKPVLTRLSGGPAQPLLVVNAAKNIRIDNLDFAIDKSFAAEGILASGFVDGLQIDNNHFQQKRTTAAGATFATSNAISVNVFGNSLGLSSVDGSYVQVLNNVIEGSTTPTATNFRAGVAMDAGVGTISGNTIATTSHDTIVRFMTTTASSTHDGISISANHFGGGGLEFAAPKAGTGPIAIDGNTISAPANADSFPNHADFALVRLIDNPQRHALTVSNNNFQGYTGVYRGVLVENFPNATFSDNTFSPKAGASDFVSLVVSNKEINSNNPAEPPYSMTIAAQRNTFHGSGVNGAGRAVEFLNDNDANGTASFGALSFGTTTAADANDFDGAIGSYFQLDNYHCETRTPISGSPLCTFIDYNNTNNLQNTQVRPFRGLISAVNNRYAGAFPRAMTPTQQAQLYAQTFDVEDDATLGRVDYGFTGGVSVRLRGPVANVERSVAADYTMEIANSAATVGENSIVHLRIVRTGGIAGGDVNLKYFDGSSYQSIPLSLSGGVLIGDFGTATGFPIATGYDVTTLLRSTFMVADTYTVQAIVQGVGSDAIYAVDSISTQVVNTAARVTLDINGPQSGIAVGPAIGGYSAHLLNSGGMTTENVLVHFAVNRVGGVGAGDLALEYDAGGGNFQSIPLTLIGGVLKGTFGPQPNGFAIGVGYDATTALRVTYTKSGTFTIDASVDGVLTPTQYASESLVVSAGAGAPASIVANGPTSFNGIAGLPLPVSPAVRVNDALGNPVSGVGVTFSVASGNGSLTLATPVSDSNGIAVLGGWILPRDAGTSLLTATVAGVAGNVSFNANGTAQTDLAVVITDNRYFVQFGKTLNYVITISNGGPSNAAGVSVTDVLPPELDVSTTSRICLVIGNASCTPSGVGDLHDTIAVPVGAAVTYLLSTTVMDDRNANTDRIVNTVTVSSSADPNPANNAPTDVTQVVILRNGFEVGGDGAQNGMPVLTALGRIDAQSSQTLRTSTVALVSDVQPHTWVEARNTQGRTVMRVELLRSGERTLARLLAIDADGMERRSEWASFDSNAGLASLGLLAGPRGAIAILAGAAATLELALGEGSDMPLDIFVDASVIAAH